jgi:tRNA A37 threonylcarbamoyladenosine biosynthesis protein TsaE
MNERADLMWSDLGDCRATAARMADWLGSLPPGARLLVLLCGTLGSGKTQLVKFLVEHLSRLGSPSCPSATCASPTPDGERSQSELAPPHGSALAATSPTFSLEHRYPTVPPLVHLDLYRIDDEDQLWELGLEETLEEPGIVLVEWANRFPGYWPRQRLSVTIDVLPDECRHVVVEASGELPIRGLRAISPSSATAG